jgi:hypothetical protein
MVAWVPLQIFMASFSFSFKMKDFLPACVREGGFRDRPPKEGAKS